MGIRPFFAPDLPAQIAHRCLDTVGLMGSREGLTPAQVETLRGLLSELAPEAVHHGDCVGAEAQFHDLVCELLPQITIVIHAPCNSSLRAYKSGHIWREPQEYLVCDGAIVGTSDVLVAAPGTFEPVEPSGTWATVSFARSIGKLDFPR